MSEVRAFVGHSFTANDEQIVQEILKLLDALSEALPNFSWDHALAAEPKDLAAKVLSKIQSKDVFIGVCTKKERVLTRAVGMPVWPFGRRALIGERDVEWKTSDWIIQEIGLAIGRGMKLILLIEKGVRKPGGLQGDIEYIEFDRDRPTDSLVRLMQMIKAISPSHALGVATSLEADTNNTERNESAGGDKDWATPTLDWDPSDYEFAYFRATFRGDADLAERLSDAFLKTAIGKDQERAAVWRAHSENCRILFGKGGDIDVLFGLARQYPDNHEILRYLAAAQSNYENYKEAAEYYEMAASKSDTSDAILLNLRSAAIAHHSAKSSELAERIADSIRVKFSSVPGVEIAALKAMQKIYEGMDRKSLALAVMERLVHLVPTDNDLRFSLAFKYSEQEHKELALFHYEKIPYQQRSGMMWNNLGVSLGQFDNPGNSVIAFKKAKDMGETLAMSNLAYSFMNAGFWEEARAECDAALKIKDHHKSIDSAVVELNEIPEREEKKKNEVIESARRKSEFMQLFGRAALEPSVNIAGTWKHPDCVLTFEASEGELRASGSFDKPRGGNLMSLGAMALSGAAKGSSRVAMSVVGQIYGNAIECLIHRDEDGSVYRHSLLSSASAHKKVLMYVSADGTLIEAMEDSDLAAPTFYTMTPVK